LCYFTEFFSKCAKVSKKTQRHGGIEASSREREGKLEKIK
jgi:hypothetical protein